MIFLKECHLVDGNGSSWSKAFDNLQDALDSATAYDQIWIASGTYTPAPSGQPGTRTDSFAMKNVVGIYGGFPNTGSPTWADRDLGQYKTIISGDIGICGDKSDNCYHGFSHPKGTDLDNSANLDGITG